MAKQDLIERTIEVASPIGEVWKALTVAEKLAQWFGDTAEVDLRPGGAIKFGWSEYGDAVAGIVEEVEEPTTFSYRWDAGTDDVGTMWTTKVTFTLDESNGVTTVTVRETGLSLLPNELYGRTLEENSSGWTAELADLVALLANASV
ncbi:MAG: SRPBCC domain-containing protein [Acidimicrobiia bacterium]|nr:SRPBCC domain-containing protein [Acidimicrobiia bacterium]